MSGFVDVLRRLTGWKSSRSLLSAQKTLGGIPSVSLTIGGHIVTAYLRAYHYEEAANEAGGLALWLDNRVDEFDDLATDYPNLTRGAVVSLSRGLVVSGSALLEELPRCWVESLEYLDDGRFLISCVDMWGLLEGFRYSSETTFTAQTHSQIAASILTNVSLTLDAGSFGFSTDFTAGIFSDGDQLLAEVMEQCHEELYFGLDGEFLWKLLESDEAVGYDYDFGNGSTGLHPLLPETQISENTARFNKVTVLGGSDLEFSGTATNTTEVTLTGQTRLRTVEEPALSSNAECLEYAEALLRQEQADAVSAVLVSRPNFSAQMYDVVSYTAPPWGGDAGSGRVIEIVERWDSDDGTWEQELNLGDLFTWALDTEEETRRGRRKHSRKSRRARRKSRRRTRARRSRRRGGSGGHRHDSAEVAGTVPIGCIVLWSGSAGAIPDGWALCDGTSGTPNLLDKFVVAAGATYAIGDTGGAATVDIRHSHADGTLAAASDSHSHTDGTLAAASDSHSHTDGTLATASDSHGHTITGSVASDSHSHSNGTLAAASIAPPATVDVQGAVDESAFADVSHGHSITGSTASDAHGHGVGTLAMGNDNHSHDVTGATASDAHGHDVTGATGSDAHGHDVTGATANSLSATQDILPPYFALAFIMRIY
jgi:hypothetical protein